MDLLAAYRVDAVLVTPAHQFPTGAVLAPGRRAALVDLAERHNVVVEDDYDAEYRYDREPVGALQGLAPSGWSTPARQARPSPRACGSAGWSSPPV